MRISRVIFFILNLILISCSGIKNKIELGELSKFHIIGINEQGLVCSALLEIKNHSYLPFQIKTIELAVLSDNIRIGNVKLSNAIRIVGHCSKKYSINFTIEFGNAEIGAFNILDYLTGNPKELRLKGNIRAKSFLLYKDIEIDKQISLDI